MHLVIYWIFPKLVKKQSKSHRYLINLNILQTNTILNILKREKHQNEHSKWRKLAIKHKHKLKLEKKLFKLADVLRS